MEHLRNSGSKGEWHVRQNGVAMAGLEKMARPLENLLMITTIAQIGGRIYERDTDRLFIKLFRERSDVVDVLAHAALGCSTTCMPLVRGQVRHYAGSGSIDIQIDFDGGPLLLIENKIDAAYSITREGHGQPQRYRASADYQCRNGREVRTILIAPQRYLTSSRFGAMFDAQVPYEVFDTLLFGSEQKLLRSAVEQAETPYEPVANFLAGDFFSSIRSLIQDRYPDLVMKSDPNANGVRPDASRTIYFDVVRTLRVHQGVPRPRMSLQCWDSTARSASVKIMLPDLAANASRLSVPQSLTDVGGYLRPAGRSLGIVIDTPRLDTQRLCTAVRKPSSGAPAFVPARAA